MAYRPFEAVEPAPIDPIFGLTELFKKDPRPDKVNLTQGVYQNAEGKNVVLHSVKQAEKILLEEETTKTYLPIAGEEQLGAIVREMVFGADHPVIAGERAATMHTPGGTGALRLGADFIRSQFPNAAIWISDPSWPSHKSVVGSAGLTAKTYPYLEPERQGLGFDAMMETLEKVPEGDVVILHACCHNPSGIDPSRRQWEQLLELFLRRPIVPFFDFAYQGFGTGLEEDAYPVRAFAQAGLEMLVSSSFSKNFGLYRERVGALTLVGGDTGEVQRAFSRLKFCARANYSNPPAHGGQVVKTVYRDPELKALWEKELDEMRHRIHQMRVQFVDGLKSAGVSRDFEFLKEQKGMFSFSGISREEVGQLREHFGVYLLENGRINVAGITPHNMDYLCASVAKVLRG